MSEAIGADKPPSQINKENILEYYSIPETELEQAFGVLKEYAEKLGLRVTLADLSQLTKVADPKALNLMHDTCQSDGLNVYLHNDLKKVGGNVGRVYDLMHVGLGHGTQWAADENGGLKYFGDASWDIATKAYVGASEPDLRTVHEYEEEAGRLGLEHVRKALDDKNNQEITQHIIQMYSDFVRRDLDYIMNYYRSGEIVDFYSNFEPGLPLLDRITIPAVLKPKSRDNPSVPLIRLS